MEEIWKDIEGYEGLYQVSNLGRVKSLERVVKFGNQHRVVKEHILSPKDNGHGYKSVGLRNRGKVSYKYIHRIVAEAFIPNPENKPQIDHINTNKEDNRVDNLRWVTPVENMNNQLTVSKVVRFTEEEIKEHRKQYNQREEVKERHNRRQREKRKENPEFYREKDRLNYLKHREHRLAYQKEYDRKKRLSA